MLFCSILNCITNNISISNFTNINDIVYYIKLHQDFNKLIFFLRNSNKAISYISILCNSILNSAKNTLLSDIKLSILLVVILSSNNLQQFNLIISSIQNTQDQNLHFSKSIVQSFLLNKELQNETIR